MIKKLIEEIKRGAGVKKYPTADRNASLLQLCRQGIPYYLARKGWSLPPLSVFVHVNTRCNLRCKFCDAGQDDKASMFYANLKGSHADDLSLDDFKKIIDKVKHFKPFIGMPALEPSLWAPLADAVRYINENGMRCSIATNGTFLEERAEELIDAGLNKVVISIDGPREHHDAIRGVPGTFEKVLASIDRLDRVKRERGLTEPQIYINYVIFEDNYQKLVDMVEQIPLDKVRQVDFRVMFFCTPELAEKHNKEFGGRYDATTACLAGGVDLKNVDVDVLWDQVQQVTSGYGGKCKMFFNHEKEGLRTYYHEPEVFLDDAKCVFPWYTMQVNTDGSVIPPQRCYAQTFGNLLEQGFEDVWNGEKMRRFRMDLQKHGRFPACTRCEGVNY